MQATATMTSPSLAQRLRWNDLILPWLVRLAFLGLGVLIGLYILAPRQARAGENYLPAAYVALPNGVAGFAIAEGVTTSLPLKLADSVAARNIGFTGVGGLALDNQLLLYALTRETTGRVTYAMNDIRSPLNVAVINAEGEVVAVHDVGVGDSRLAVPEPHRWLLTARAGTIENLGIGLGSTFDPESVRKVNY